MNKEQAIRQAVDRWGFIVGGIVDNDTRYLEAAIREAMGLPHKPWIYEQAEYYGRLRALLDGETPE